jgi:peptidoglycan/xylan/chitin deacetylase (PgdA/CDA1 family)
MKKKRSKKSRKSVLPISKNLLIAIGGLLIIVIAVLLLALYKKPPQIDYRKPDMKKLPPDIKKELQVSSPSATFRVPILLYHYVEYVQDKRDTIRQSLDIIPSVFEKQLQTLSGDGYTFITPSDVADVLDGKKTMPNKPIILSFDDGYRDFYTDVLPLLEKYHARAVAYVVPGFLDTPNFLLTSQLVAVSQTGLVEVAAHTMHHVSLKGMAVQRATDEIDKSKQTLEDLLHIPVVSFAYPYGAFDKQAVELVKNAGFKTAASTIPGIEVNQADRFFLYRIRPGVRTGPVLLRFLQQSSFSMY